MIWQPSHPAYRTLLAAFLDEVAPVYVVGGAVRDHLMQRAAPLTDLDLVVDQPALPTARRVADRLGWSFFPLDEAFDVARLVFTSSTPPLVCDVARMRGLSIEEDLQARDYTVNAMAFSLDRQHPVTLVDAVGGQQDLRDGRLRRVTAASLAEDSVRLLRSVRLMAQLDLTLDEETRLQVLRLASSVKLCSPERVRDELWKMLKSDRAAWAIDQLRQLGLLIYVLPEVAGAEGIEQSYPHHADVYHHILETVDRACQLRNWISGSASSTLEALDVDVAAMLEPWRFRLREHFMQAMAADRLRLDWLIWHALLHDVGKPAERTAEVQPNGAVRYRFIDHETTGARLAVARLNRLRFGRQEVALAQAVVAGHMRPHLLDASFAQRSISRRARYRFFRDVGGRQFVDPAGVDTVLLTVADHQAIYREEMPYRSTYLAHMAELLDFAYAETGLDETAQRPLVDGHTLMTNLDLLPGPQVGELLERLREAQAAGEVSSPAQALDLATSWLRGSPQVVLDA